MRIILLAGYRPTTADNCPWLAKIDGVPVLEKRLREARELSPNCIVVLAGESADEALRVCPTLEHCELVFDTEPGRQTLLSNLRVALEQFDLPALVLPAELEFGDVETVKKLTSAAVQHGLSSPIHVLQTPTQSFPLVLTAQGCKTVKFNMTIEGLADPQLTRVPCL